MNSHYNFSKNIKINIKFNILLKKTLDPYFVKKIGDSISVSTARKYSTTTVYKKDVDRKTREMLLPSRDMFAHREVF